MSVANAYTVFARVNDRLPTLLLSAETLSHPNNACVEIAECVWQRHNVGTSLNMACNVTRREHHQQAWRMNDVRWHEVPIWDNMYEPVRESLMTDVLRVHEAHMVRFGAARAILVNCLAGMNRSALAVALLLWHTTPAAERPWPSVDALIAYMRLEQHMQRDMPRSATLCNEEFEAYLRRVCL